MELSQYFPQTVAGNVNSNCFLFDHNEQWNIFIGKIVYKFYLIMAEIERVFPYLSYDIVNWEIIYGLTTLI